MENAPCLKEGTRTNTQPPLSYYSTHISPFSSQGNPGKPLTFVKREDPHQPLLRNGQVRFSYYYQQGIPTSHLLISKIREEDESYTCWGFFTM